MRTDKHFEQPREGEWLRPVKSSYVVACCDCGLVHTINFRITDSDVEFQVFSAPRETKLLRRLEARTLVFKER